MLVLSRRPGEWIQIGTDVVVKVESIGGGRTKLSIEAPREQKILRGELVRTDTRQDVSAGSDASDAG